MGNDINSISRFRSIQVSNDDPSPDADPSIQNESERPTAPSYQSGFSRAAPPPPIDMSASGGKPPFLDAAATALGMSSDDLDTALKSGKSLTQVASDRGVSTDTLRTALAADFQSKYPNATDAQASTEADKAISGPSGKSHGGHKPVFGDAAAEALGLSSDDLDTALGSGKTMTDVASDQGVSVDSLKAALAADFSSRHPNATDDQANAAAERAISGPSASSSAPQRPPFIEAAANALGISTDDLDTALRSGQTLAQVATAQGVSTDDLKTALTADIQTNRPDVSTEDASALAERILTKTAPQPFRARDLQRAALSP